MCQLDKTKPGLILSISSGGMRNTRSQEMKARWNIGDNGRKGVTLHSWTQVGTTNKVRKSYVWNFLEIQMCRWNVEESTGSLHGTLKNQLVPHMVR